MTAKLQPQLPHIIPNRFVQLLDSKERALKLALCFSFILHMVMLLPTPRFKSPWKDSGNLMEVSLVTPKSQPHHQAKSSPPIKRNLKQKLKAKTKKQPAILKKRPTIAKKSPLAKQRSIPKKNTVQTNEKFEEIKKKLAHEREKQKLDDIRQRLKKETSSAFQVRQAHLTQAYQMQLKTWLMRNWHLPEHLLNSGLEATISLTIDASGKLLEQNEEKLSNNQIFDNAMHQAVINADPYPAFPSELNIPQEEFVITFNPNNLKR